MRDLSLTQKIWTSISFLILGYVVSMAVAFFLSQRSEKHLDHIRNTLLPAQQHSEAALASFVRQNDYFKEAVLLGEEELLLNAELSGRNAETSLKILSRLAGIDEAKNAEVPASIVSVTPAGTVRPPVTAPITLSR